MASAGGCPDDYFRIDLGHYLTLPIRPRPRTDKESGQRGNRMELKLLLHIPLKRSLSDVVLYIYLSLVLRSK